MKPESHRDIKLDRVQATAFCNGSIPKELPVFKPAFVQNEVQTNHQ